MLTVIKLLVILAGMVLFIMNVDVRPRFAAIGAFLIAGGCLA